MSRKKLKKICGLCGGRKLVSAFWQIGNTGIVPLVPCPRCHGDGYE